MHTLIINGSPRKLGATSTLTKALTELLPGEVREIATYRANVSPCLDCRYCWEHPGCTIEDDMQEIYRLIDEADAIVLASPIYFAELTGSLLSWASRLQTIFASRRFRGVPALQQKLRRGALILVDGGHGDYQTAEAMGRRLLRTMGAPCGPMLYYSGTDLPERADPMQDPAAVQTLQDLAAYLRGEELKRISC